MASISGARVLVVGSTGMLGSALVRRLKRAGSVVIETRGRHFPDLRRQEDAEALMRSHQPDVVFLVGGLVGSIAANSRQPVDFLYDNLMIGANVIRAARNENVRHLVYPASSCIYPKHAPLPIRESHLLSGPLEPTNQWFAVAKIAVAKLVEAYRVQDGLNYTTAMLASLYGPGDNFDPAFSHVIPGLMRRMHEAVRDGQKEVVVWGTGTPSREFLHVDDAAAAMIFLVENAERNDSPLLNAGYGREITIRTLATKIAGVVGFTGKVIFDHDKPDGTPSKLLNSTKMIALGWSPTVNFNDGLRAMYEDFKATGGKKLS
jgi:GDP-L-fucose synthase